ncbi:class I SAM-dependent methyltransferase [Nocardia sp. NPDC004278]
MIEEDPKELVRRGYNALSDRYDEAFRGGTKYEAWLRELDRHVVAAGTVLDLGCGSGMPVARTLAGSGRRVIGVDISDVQIDKARALVPTAEFICADAATIHFEPGSFDAVVCLYALIHMPLDEQSLLLTRIAEWLRPNGWFVTTTGHDSWTGIDPNWLGGDATMWWSQADAATYRSWLTQAGLTVVGEEFVPEGTSGHTLFWTVKEPHGTPPSAVAR